jgi:hypothetical protein
LVACFGFQTDKPLLIFYFRRMPRYYFARDNQPPETEGEELPDDAAARRVALAVAEELGRCRPERPQINIYNRDLELI